MSNVSRAPNRSEQLLCLVVKIKVNRTMCAYQVWKLPGSKTEHRTSQNRARNLIRKPHLDTPYRCANWLLKVFPRRASVETHSESLNAEGVRAARGRGASTARPASHCSTPRRDRCAAPRALGAGGEGVGEGVGEGDGECVAATPPRAPPH